MRKAGTHLSRAEIAHTMKKGKRANGALFSYVFLPSPVGRASVVVSKKVAKTAVGRNLLRRRAYAALRATLPTVAVPVSIVCIARAGLSGASVARMEKELILYFKQKKVNTIPN